MEQRVGMHMPVALDILHTKHEACQNEAVDVYRHTSIFDDKINKYAAKLEVTLHRFSTRLVYLSMGRFLYCRLDNQTVQYDLKLCHKGNNLIV